MAKKLGHEYKLFVGDGEVSEAFSDIAGETGLTFDAPTNFIDTSSKTSGRYGEQTPGRSSLTITASGKLELPDASGLERVNELDAATPKESGNFQIRVAPFTEDDVVFQAAMFVGNFNKDFSDQDNATWTFSLGLDGPPDVDLLVPAVTTA
jgi:predicted secreted protein